MSYWLDWDYRRFLMRGNGSGACQMEHALERLRHIPKDARLTVDFSGIRNFDYLGVVHFVMAIRKQGYRFHEISIRGVEATTESLLKSFCLENGKVTRVQLRKTAQKGPIIMANILIVDSYFPIGLPYCEVLQEQGHRVFVAMSGEEALLLGLYENIDITVMDDTLPDFEAEELLGKLKRLQPHIRGILSISSTFGSPGNIRMWDGTFIKTNDFSVLEAEIERLLRGTSTAVSAPPLKGGEYEIAPKYV